MPEVRIDKTSPPLPCKLFIDGSAAHLNHELKHGYCEYVKHENLKPELVQSYISSACREQLIVPANFEELHKQMAKQTIKFLAHKCVKIHPWFDKLIIINSATKDDEYSLDKSESAFINLFNTFRLALLFLHSSGE